MSKWPACWRVILILILGCVWSGCVPIAETPLDEEKDPNFIDGRNHLNMMDYKGAIECFERAVQANPRNAAAHFELGILYQQRMNDPVAAIYHFQKHLQLRPKSERLEVIKQMVVGCKLDIAKTVTFGVVTAEVHRDLAKLTNDFALVKQQNEALRHQLATTPRVVTQWMKFMVTQYVQVQIRATNEVARSSIAPPATNYVAPRGSAPPTAANTNRVTSPSRTLQAQIPSRAPVDSRASALRAPRTHLVRSGETMAEVARRYGISLQKIQAANPSLEPRRLRAGQTLNIPSQ